MVDVQSACGRPGSHRRSSVSDRGSPRLRVVPPTHLPTAGPPSPRRSGGRPRSTRPPLPARARQAPTQWWKEPGTTRDTSATRPGYTKYPSGHLSDNEQTREIRLHVANVRMRCQCGCRRPRSGWNGGKRKTWALSTLARKLGVDVTSRCACGRSTRWPFRHAIVVAPWRRVRGATRIPRNAAPATSRS